MARKVEITLIDDLDGSTANETVHFGLDGSHYEIDLGDANASTLREALAPFIARARRSIAYSASEAPAIRAWAAENGFKVSERGRLHSEVIDAYREVHPES
ncbi:MULTISPECIES: histone-like nucleoid-structuring protein Lsr2 [Micrococcaceae]|uniref:Histone protein Lsr2 n=1 Tax=Arthrobacter rhombi TaxID=71253 RepID=A0A1R4G3E0_9MICC|nr:MULTISPECIES: Lsr2 family protein [Micrococcaceae]PCC24145.1 Lsr2 family protein [Glutamicibacter sp. BW78]SJM62502.1 Histone protein Lsr2 [Arthrobacter rhombi]